MKISEARVAWVAPRLGYDGNLMYWGNLLDAFSQLFREFQVFTSGDPGVVVSGRLTIQRCGLIRSLGSRVHPNKPRYGAVLNIASPRVISCLMRYNPDLVVAVEFGPMSLYAILHSRLRRPRARLLLVVENKPWFATKSFLGFCRTLLRRRMARKADAVLTNSAAGASYLIETLGLSQERIVAKPYLVSQRSPRVREAIQPKTPPGDGRVRFLFVGRLLPLKGLSYALQALNQLLPRYAGRFTFEIVGDGPCRKALELEAQELGLKDQVVFHGSQEYEQVNAFYEEAHVFVLPTLGDYRALVPFEAIVAGMPILCSTYNGGLAEVVVEGENGFSFDPLDPEKLACLLTKFIDEPALISLFSEKSLLMARSYTLSGAANALAEAAELALRPR